MYTCQSGAFPCAFYTPVVRRYVLWYGDVRPSIRPSVRVSVRQSQFSAFLLWCIELIFCMSLFYYEHSIKFDCCQFPSSFVGVMPLLELKMLEIHSFPQFSPSCFDILSWNFTHNFVLLTLQIRFECPQFLLIFVGVMPLLELRILVIHSFLHISPTSLTYWADILHMTLFYCTTDQV